MKDYPHPLISAIPIIVLIGLLITVISLFGSDSLTGGSQVALLLGTAVCVTISMTVYLISWHTFEKQIIKTIGSVSITLVILLAVGMVSGSWTTIATIGVALLGISHALGISEAWAAGAIISGAYFGDKMSPLSDTTILASSATGVDLFEHIRYMVFTTVPSFTIALIIFFISGLGNDGSSVLKVSHYTGAAASITTLSHREILVL